MVTLTKLLSLAPQSPAWISSRTLFFLAPSLLSNSSARRIAFLYFLAQALSVEALVLLYCSYLNLFSNPSWDIFLPVVLANHAATCRDVCFFKCFFAFSSAANSSGIGSYRSGLSGFALYPNGTVLYLPLLKLGTDIQLLCFKTYLGCGSSQRPSGVLHSFSFTVLLYHYLSVEESSNHWLPQPASSLFSPILYDPESHGQHSFFL